MLRLLSFLQTPRDWTGAELAERLEVSQRTIRNDIERLRSLGYQVHATRGPIGGYRLASGTTVPPLLLDDDEAVALAVALRTGAGGGTDGIEASSMRALAKLEQVLPARLRSRVHALQTHTVLVRRRSHSTVDRGPPHDAGRDLPRPSRPALRLRGPARIRQPASCRAPSALSMPRVAGTWSPGTPTGRTGGRSGSTGSAPRSSPGTGSAPRELSDEEITALISRGVPPAARRYRTRVTILAPAAAIAERIGPWVGTLEPIDALDLLPRHRAPTTSTSSRSTSGLLNVDFIVTEPPELVTHLHALGERYARAVRT